jgi:hypothetical protein
MPAPDNSKSQSTVWDFNSLDLPQIIDLKTEPENPLSIVIA